MTSGVVIRPFEGTEAEYEAIAAVERAAQPDFEADAVSCRYQDATSDPKYLRQRFVAEEGGRLVATGLCCEPTWAWEPGKYFIHFNADPRRADASTAEMLFRHVMKFLADRRPRLVTIYARADAETKLRILAGAGFREVTRFPVSQLDLARFDPSAYEPLLDELTASGIRLRSFSELEPEDDRCRHELHELHWRITRELPLPERPTRPTFAEFSRAELDHPGFLPGSWIIATAGERFVGTAHLAATQGSREKLTTGLTGVLPSYRRRGIARALKARSLGFAKSQGTRWVVTSNREDHPMYALNLELGFESRPALLFFEKRSNGMKEDGDHDR